MPGLSINSGVFLQKLAESRGRRSIKALLDTIGPERLLWAITQNKDLLGFLPADAINQDSLDAGMAKQAVNQFTDDDIYLWIPENYRSLFEHHPQGKEWTLRQIGLLKQVIGSA